MATNSITIAAPPEHVFDVLADPHAYARWVPGTTEIVEADACWPEPGTRLVFRAVVPWLGETQVLESAAPRRLVLRARLPVGSMRICIDLHPVHGGTVVYLHESLEGRAAAAFDAPIHIRNVEALRRLKQQVEGEAGAGGIAAFRALAPAHWLDTDPYRNILRGADPGYLAIHTPRGPHVTPTAFTSWGGRLWMLTARSSLKARTVRRAGRVAFLGRSDDKTILVRGRAVVLDPLRAWIPEHLTERAQALPALGAYIRQNVRRLAVLGQQLPQAPIPNPATRVAIVIAPQSVVALQESTVIAMHGDDLVHDGSPGDDRVVDGSPLDLAGAPADIVALAEEERRAAVLAWASPGGVIALPARWHPSRDLVSVPASLITSQPQAAPAALCLDRDTPGDVAEQKGLLVRGQGRVVGIAGDYAAVEIEGERTTVWRGTRSITLDDA